MGQALGNARAAEQARPKFILRICVFGESAGKNNAGRDPEDPPTRMLFLAELRLNDNGESLQRAMSHAAGENEAMLAMAPAYRFDVAEHAGRHIGVTLATADIK